MTIDAKRAASGASKRAVTRGKGRGKTLARAPRESTVENDRTPVVAPSKPLIAVVIPAYKQPQYLKDAVFSAIRQTMRARTKVVIVNDGCPYAETDWLGKYFQDCFPDEVVYLKKRNGGLSSARNYGIGFALDAWPSLRAIFPLDADNKLSPSTLELLYEKLEASDEKTGWIFQDMTFFGTEDTVCHTELPYSLYRLVHENYCEAGNLIKREVYESGVNYDESMKSGYEDWEFYLNAGLNGFVGEHVSDTGFLYRKHGHSMLSDSKTKHEAIYSYMKKKHARVLGPNAITVLEHLEMPRFALISTDTNTVRYVTNAMDSAATEYPLEHFIGNVFDETQEKYPKRSYAPPIALFARSEHLAWLSRLGLLPSLLLSVQKSLSRCDYASLSLDLHDNPFWLDIARATGGEKILFAVTPRKWLELQHVFGREKLHEMIAQPHGLVAEDITVRAGVAHFGPHDKAVLGALCGDMRNKVSSRDARIRDLQNYISDLQGKVEGAFSNQQAPEAIDWNAAPAAPAAATVPLFEDAARIWDLLPEETGGAMINPANTRHDWYASPPTDYAVYKHVDQAATTFPYCNLDAPLSTVDIDRTVQPINILFVMPWLKLGGVEKCVLHLASELDKLDSRYRLHLVLTEKNEIEAEPRWLEMFETISFLPPEAADRYPALMEILGFADAIINAHSLDGYQLLAEIKSKNSVKYFSYLHVTDLDPQGNPCGYPIIASRQYENLIDGFLVISQQMRRACMNLGVPSEKIHHLPNAPALSPPDAQSARALTETKCARRYSEKDPMRILFSGRFDVQKGVDRLEAIVEELEKSGVPFSLDIVGKPVIGDDLAPKIASARFLPATLDANVLARYYSNADVFLLPSRWEGVPLTILEAMSFGALAVATDVGAVEELIEDGANGFLIDSQLPEDEMAETIAEVLARIARGGEEMNDMRRAACEFAMNASWNRSARTLASVLETALKPAGVQK